jgi:CheY-like chemotaxis protein
MAEASENIVIIDDDPDVNVVLSRRLKKLGYHAEAYEEPSEAIKQIRSKKPDLVISDINMPGLNGFEVCNLIREDPKTQHIPIIMITGIDEARKQAAAMGGNDIYYLSKPVESEDLLKVIRIALSASFEM